MVDVDSARGPDLQEIRPVQALAGSATSTTFPVYADLADRLLSPLVDPATGAPDPVTAHVMAVLSTYAYSDLATMTEMAARLGLARCHALRVQFANDPQFIASTAYLLQSEDGRVGVLVYRGTEPANILSWLTDVDATPDRVRIGGPDDEPLDVHAGFYRNVRATRYRIAQALVDAVEGRSVTGAPGPALSSLEALFVTGHSLGGAMAALMGVLLREDPDYRAQLGDRLRAVYTFGQPMVGSPGLAARYQDDPVLGVRTFRYVFEGDPVPRLPSADTGRWQHFGQELRHVTRVAGEGWEGPGAGSPVGQIRFVGQLVVAFGSLPLSQLVVLSRVPVQYRIDDHRPHHYVAALTPRGVPTEFGDHAYEESVALGTRVRRQVEELLRRLAERVPG